MRSYNLCIAVVGIIDSAQNVSKAFRIYHEFFIFFHNALICFHSTSVGALTITAHKQPKYKFIVCWLGKDLPECWLIYT